VESCPLQCQIGASSRTATAITRRRNRPVPNPPTLGPAMWIKYGNHARQATIFEIILANVVDAPLVVQLPFRLPISASGTARRGCEYLDRLRYAGCRLAAPFGACQLRLVLGVRQIAELEQH